MHRITKIFVVAGLLVMAVIFLNCSDKSTEPEPADNIATWQYAFVDDWGGMYNNLIQIDNNWTIAVGTYMGQICIDRFDNLGNKISSETYGDLEISANWGGSEIRECADGKFYALGQALYPFPACILKIGAAGGQLSERIISPDNGSLFSQATLILSDDGGYVFAALECSNDYSAHDVVIGRVDSEDSINYQRAPVTDMLGFVLESALTSDGNLLLIGQTLNGENTEIQTLVIDTGGAIISENSFGSSMDDMIRDVIDVGNDQLLAVGGSSGGTSGEKYIYLVKLDSNGDVVWDKRIGSGNLFGQQIASTKDGNFIIGADFYSDPQNPLANLYSIYLLKVDPSGTVIWEKLVDAGSYESFCRGLTETSDGGFAIDGFSRGFGPKAQYRYIAKTDSHGNCIDSITIIEE